MIERIETRRNPSLVELWCKNCEHENSYAAEDTLYCIHCRKADGEAPCNYVKDDSIKDSGERTEFSTGAVRDMHEGKGRFDLLPWPAIWEVAKHCENGAKKYGEHNVDKGIPIHSLIDSAIRHLVKFWLGWDDEPHLTAACWNALWALNMMLVKPEMDDRPDSGFPGPFGED